MLVRFKPVTSIIDDFDRIINSTLHSYPEFNRTNRLSGVSMKDTGEQVLVNVELPGIAKEDVKVNVNDLMMLTALSYKLL